MADTERCDQEVFERGTVAAITTLSKGEAEALCRNLSEATGWKWDWNFAAGRAVIRFLQPTKTPAPPQDALREARKVLDFARGYGEAARNETTTKAAIHYLRERLCDAAKEYEAAALPRKGEGAPELQTQSIKEG